MSHARYTPLSNEELVARAANLPPVDPAALRADVDALLDTAFLAES
jgi:hypothetical protein